MIRCLTSRRSLGFAFVPSCTVRAILVACRCSWRSTQARCTLSRSTLAGLQCVCSSSHASCLCLAANQYLPSLTALDFGVPAPLHPRDSQLGRAAAIAFLGKHCSRLGSLNFAETSVVTLLDLAAFPLPLLTNLSLRGYTSYADVLHVLRVAARVTDFTLGGCHTLKTDRTGSSAVLQATLKPLTTSLPAALITPEVLTTFPKLRAIAMYLDERLQPPANLEQLRLIADLEDEDACAHLASIAKACTRLQRLVLQASEDSLVNLPRFPSLTSLTWRNSDSETMDYQLLRDLLQVAPHTLRYLTVPMAHVLSAQDRKTLQQVLAEAEAQGLERVVLVTEDEKNVPHVRKLAREFKWLAVRCDYRQRVWDIFYPIKIGTPNIDY